MAYDRDSVVPEVIGSIIGSLIGFAINTTLLMVAFDNINEAASAIPAFGFTTCWWILLAASILFDHKFLADKD